MMIPYLCPGAAGAAEGSAAQPGEDPARLHERGARQLAGVRRAQAVRRLCAGELSQLFSLESSRHHRLLPKHEVARASRFSCTWCARPASRDFRNTIRIAPGAPSSSRLPSRPSSATSAISWAARSKTGGFDPARDITAITVNRWPHGYAPEYNPLFEPDLPEDRQPHVLGRAQFGRITIANSDAGGEAYTDSAINQGHRAVMELLRS